ncbi:MAG: hypothetical protein H6Q71_395 [Firmicutes bacterium]|nr:hypothetical protein [Bacillota bacterium]
MPESISTSKEAEEFSLLLDKLNSGTIPESDNEETAELLAVAALLKKAEISVPPPQHIVDQTVDKIIRAMPARRPSRSKTWLYSGVVGTAASVLLIISLNFISPWTQKPSLIPPPVIGTNQVTAPDQNAPSEKFNATQQTLVSQAVPDPSAHKQPSVIPSNVSPADESKISSNKEIASVPPLVTSTHTQLPGELPLPSNSAVLDHAMKEQAVTTGDTKPARKWASSPPAKSPKSIPFVQTVLSLPGLVPDSTAINKESGTIVQVYYKGTPQEIIITQRLLNNLSTTPTSNTPHQIDENGEKPGTSNKVTAKIFGQEVSVEGLQTKQDLLKLLQSLVP